MGLQGFSRLRVKGYETDLSKKLKGGAWVPFPPNHLALAMENNLKCNKLTRDKLKQGCFFFFLENISQNTKGIGIQFGDPVPYLTEVAVLVCS